MLYYSTNSLLMRLSVVTQRTVQNSFFSVAPALKSIKTVFLVFIFFTSVSATW